MRDTSNFNKIFWYIVATTSWVLLYVMLITFIQIPKENQRFVDISLAFLLGFMSGCSNYLIGGTPSSVKKNSEGTTTADITATITTEPKQEKTEG